VSALTAGLAVALGRSDWPVVGAAALAGQLSVGWCNDARDGARDSQAGREDKPVAAGLVAPALLWGLALVALAAAFPLSWWAGGPDALLVHLVAIGAAWAYNLGLKATVLSWVPYAVAFALLPAFVWLGLPGSPWPPWWVMLTAALLGTAAHLTNALPDRHADTATGCEGIATRMPPRTTRLLTAGLVLGAVVVAAFGAPGPITPARWLSLAAALVLTGQAVRPPRRVGERRPMFAVGGVAAIGVLLVATAFDIGAAPA
jgi:4-hydroxybenzoate polyprenyltransferase